MGENWSTNYDEFIEKYLKNSKNVEAYLNAALEEEDPRAFLIALKNVIRVRGGIGEIAKITKRNREQLYRTLSSKGNPTFNNLNSLVDAVGFRIHVKRKPRDVSKSKPKTRSGERIYA